MKEKENTLFQLPKKFALHFKNDILYFTNECF